MLRQFMLWVWGRVEESPDWIEMAAEEGWRAYKYADGESIMMRLLDKK